ncbi:MAG: hypothetical protein ACI4AX_08035 [Muribaculaceae bacterium]
MKKIIRTAAALILCAALMTEGIEARGRKDYNDNRNRQEQTRRPGQNGGGNQNRPGNNRPGNHGGGNQNRPGNNGGNHNRPGNNGGNHNRPGNNGGNHNRPGDNHYRPGNNRPPQAGFRPGHNPGYNPGHNPGYRPGHHPGHHPGHDFRPGPVYRPHLPPPRPFYRPVPPPHYRPVAPWRPFTTILGVAIGTSINLSVNVLINSGYNVAGYANDMVYLNNVPMLNMLWPDATLYYNSYGGLYSSEFVYYSPFYDMSRYNMAMSRLVGTYGQPVSIQNTAAGLTATWWGGNNCFIRLTYGSQYAGNGNLNYYTTLSFGN